MSEEIKIPKILQDREGPTLRERAGEVRNRMSRKMARFLADITFDKSSIHIDEYDDDNPDKYNQDMAFASYEENLRVTHLNTQRKKIGSYIMMTPVLGTIAEFRSDARASKQRLKDQQELYRQRNGTFKSKLRDKYVAHKREFAE